MDDAQVWREWNKIPSDPSGGKPYGYCIISYPNGFLGTSPLGIFKPPLHSPGKNIDPSGHSAEDHLNGKRSHHQGADSAYDLLIPLDQALAAVFQ